MHMALKPLMLLFAVALLVLALTQPASAHFNPCAPRAPQKPDAEGVNLQKLAVENARIRLELKAARERTRRVRKELDELRRKFSLLRGAVCLRDKLENERPACPSCAGNRRDRQLPEVRDKRSDGQAKQPGVVKRLLHNEYVKYLRRKIEEVVLSHIRPRPQAITAQHECESPPPTEKNNATHESTPDAKPLRERIDTLRKRLKSTLEKHLKRRLESAALSAPAPKKVQTQPQRGEKPSAPQVQKELRNELLRQLRNKFRTELDKKLKELKRDVTSKGHEKKQRSKWF